MIGFLGSLAITLYIRNTYSVFTISLTIYLRISLVIG